MKSSLIFFFWAGDVCVIDLDGGGASWRHSFLACFPGFPLFFNIKLPFYNEHKISKIKVTSGNLYALISQRWLNAVRARLARV